jgi:arabinose-5-phosphate isomerase
MKLMSSSGLGLTISTNSQGQPTGVFTDGDLRRELMRGTDITTTKPHLLMRKTPKTIFQNALAADAAAKMESLKITSLLVTDPAGKLVGVLNTNDLMRAKVI